jgi:amino acid transporter
MANGAVLALAFIVAIGFALAFPPADGAPTAYTIEFGYLAGIGAIAIEVIYVFVSVAAIVWFRREMKNEYNVFKHLVVPIVAVIGAGAALYGSLLPQPDPLMATMPYVALAWIVIGLVYILYLRSAKPGLVAKIGRDLAEMDVPEPVDVRFQHDAGK